jgi:outer membrane protein assembly factor BamB
LTLAPSFAATTTTWEMTGYQDFLRGRISGLSLSRDGRLTLGSKLDTLFDSGQPEIWSVAQAPDGSLYLGTGHRGRLYKLDAAGKSSLVWTSDQSEIFAVAVDSKGAVFAGTSPDGKVYRIENGKATEYFSPGARYIWALKAAPDGSLYVGTGDQGKIFRVTAPGIGSVYYDTGQSHVTCLELDGKGALLAGSEPNGILYRITAANKAFVLYDANLPEIRAIVPAADGNLYVAALGGSVARRIGSVNGGTTGAASGGIAPVVATVTVTDQQAGLAQPPKAEAPKTSVAIQSTVTATPAVEYAGVDKSALYVIHPDNTVETLWSSKEENIYDVAMFNSALLFVTDVQGRLYRLDRDRKATLVAQSNEGEATRLLATWGRFCAWTRAPFPPDGSNRRCTILPPSRVGAGSPGAGMPRALLFERAAEIRCGRTPRGATGPRRSPIRITAESPVRTRVTFNGARSFREARLPRLRSIA